MVESDCESEKIINEWNFSTLNDHSFDSKDSGQRSESAIELAGVENLHYKSLSKKSRKKKEGVFQCFKFCKYHFYLNSEL